LPLIVSLDESLGLTAAGGEMQQLQAFMAGMSSTYTDTWMHNWRGLQVNFTPLGAYQFLGRPMSELANHSTDLAELLGAEGRIVTERIVAARDPDATFAILEEAITKRLARGTAPSEAMAWAWAQIRQEPAVDIGWLGERLGWSRKQMAARFREEIGLTPKVAARVLRFARANDMASRSERPDWADIAAECGFYDQSHLVRDFQEFTGTTPTGYLAHVVQMPQFEE
jgi:AraC-like DNA-binding protein